MRAHRPRKRFNLGPKSDEQFPILRIMRCMGRVQNATGGTKYCNSNLGRYGILGTGAIEIKCSRCGITNRFAYVDKQHHQQTVFLAY
jgi:phage FluMu protein Com